MRNDSFNQQIKNQAVGQIYDNIYRDNKLDVESKVTQQKAQVDFFESMIKGFKTIGELRNFNSQIERRIAQNRLDNANADKLYKLMDEQEAKLVEETNKLRTGQLGDMAGADKDWALTKKYAAETMTEDQMREPKYQKLLSDITRTDNDADRLYYMGEKARLENNNVEPNVSIVIEGEQLNVSPAKAGELLLKQRGITRETNKQDYERRKDRIALAHKNINSIIKFYAKGQEFEFTDSEFSIMNNGGYKELTKLAREYRSIPDFNRKLELSFKRGEISRRKYDAALKTSTAEMKQADKDLRVLNREYWHAIAPDKRVSVDHFADPHLRKLLDTASMEGGTITYQTDLGAKLRLAPLGAGARFAKILDITE